MGYVSESTLTLSARDLEKVYTGTGEPVLALQGVSLTLEPGEFVAVMGPSGCGKSTLLHVCGAMDRPTRGSVRIGKMDLAALDDGALTRLRRETIGFVFQFFNLLPMLTVRENIALPLLLAGADSAAALREATRIAERVGLTQRLGHRPAQLSGGEMQRAAIARAMVHRPALLVADEPTGNLDSANGARILELLADLHRETGVSILLATHSDEVAALADRIIRMRDGRIEGADAPHPNPLPAAGGARGRNEGGSSRVDAPAANGTPERNEEGSTRVDSPAASGAPERNEGGSTRVDSLAPPAAGRGLG
jgi:putative ABC transport system ATP-binding protein